MARGRRPDGSRMADKVAIDDPEQRRRLRLILATIAGECSIGDAADELGITPEAFRRLRWRAVEQMALGLEARPPGPSPELGDAGALSDRVAELEAENVQLKVELECQRLREEIAAVMPHVLIENRDQKKQKRTRAVHWRQRLDRERGHGGA